MIYLRVIDLLETDVIIYLNRLDHHLVLFPIVKRAELVYGREKMINLIFYG